LSCVGHGDAAIGAPQQAAEYRLFAKFIIFSATAPHTLNDVPCFHIDERRMMVFDYHPFFLWAINARVVFVRNRGAFLHSECPDVGAFLKHWTH
jgi:hypothetical protein